MARTDYPSTFGAFVVDPNDVRLNSGRQIDWANVAASYAGDDGVKVLPAGTIVAEKDADNKLLPRGQSTAGEPAGSNPAAGTATIGLLATSAREDSRTDSLSGYGVLIGAHVYENLLPDADDGEISAGLKTELGALFTFETYEDSRVPPSDD